MRIGPRVAFVGPDQLTAQADVPSTDYTLRGTAEDPGQVVVHSGVSVRRLLVLGGADPDAVAFVAVPRANGGTAYLQGQDFADPSPFPEGPALVWVDADATHFFRPVRDARDVNAPDNIATTSGVALVVSAHTGALLAVSASAGKGRVRTGEPVSFSASATGARAGETLSYRWTFDDGRVASGPRVRHTFSAEGRYNVVVSVAGDQDSSGSGPVLPIAVGAARKAAAEGSGGTNRDRGAPGAGPAQGPRRGQGTPPRRAASQPGGSPQAARAPGQAAPGPPRRAAAAPARRAAPRRRPEGAARRSPAERPGGPPGTPVRGILLAASTPDAAARSLAAGRPRAALRAGSARDLQIPGVIVVGAALLLLGAGLEHRRSPRAA